MYLWKILGEVHHDLRLCSPEGIDGLIVISYNEQIVPGRCQHFYNVVLELIDILELIHQNILELLPPPCQDVRSLVQQVIAIQEHIVEVQKPRPAAG